MNEHAGILGFHAGDHPPNLVDWRLVEPLNIDAQAEVWQARSDGGPATLVFLLDPTARRRLLDTGTFAPAQLLHLEKHPSLVPLEAVHPTAEPPCLRYAPFSAADLRGLVQPRQTAESVARILLQIVEGLAHLHRQRPALIHRALRPALIRVEPVASAGPHCRIAGLGLGELLPVPSGETARYASPEQMRDLPPDPRDDVYALGILWYQMLTGDANAGRPGGSRWRKKLVEQGVPPAQLELLESCFEDNAADRPADAHVLASRFREWVQPASAPESTEPVAGKPRLRSRRADVQQLFSTLQEKERELPKVVTTDLGLKLVLIPAGAFLMGSPETEVGRRLNEGPTHEVSITRPYYLSAHPVTQGQFEKVMGRNPSKHNAETGGSPNHPVEYVTWEEAVEFCRRLSEGERVYRLPTEAEWEYACRAGTTTSFSLGEALSPAQANFDANFPYGDVARGRFLEQTTAVGIYPPNNFGLHDMHGNVWEWCADWFDSEYYRHSPRRDPAGSLAAKYRVIRGGSWINHAVTCRSAHRNGLAPNRRDGCTGFRVVVSTM
jgi:formylglycine-generating enzyme required for sulfatase activity